MRIEEIQVDGFGHLKGTRLQLDGDLVCVLGDNEAGKSTLLAFVRGILFGFNQSLTKEQRERMGVDGRTTPYDPVEGGTKGGSVTLVVQQEGTEVRYRFTRQEIRRKDGDLTIIDLSRNKEHTGEDAERLRDRLLSVDGALFGTIFAIGLDELHTVKALDKDAVQGVLFAADAGIGADIVAEMDALTKTLDEGYRPKGQKPRINALNRELAALNKAIREARDEVATHRGDQEEHERLQAEIREQSARCDTFLHEAEQARRRTEARAVLHRIQVERARRAPFAEEVLPTVEDRDLHTTLKSQIAAALDSEKEARERLVALQAERARIVFEEHDADADAHLPSVDPEEVERLVASARLDRRLRAEQEADDGPYLSPTQRTQLERLNERIDQLENHVRTADGQIQQAEARRDAARHETLDEATEHRLRALVQQDVGALEREHERRVATHREARERAERAVRSLGGSWDPARIAAAPVDHASEAKALAALPTDGHVTTGSGTAWPMLAVGAGLLALGLLGLAGLLFEPVAGAVLVLAGLVVGYLAFTGRKTTTVDPGTSAKTTQVLAPYGLPPTTTRDAFRGFVATLRDAHDRVETERQAARAAQETDERVERLRAALQEAAHEAGLGTAPDLHEVQRRVRLRLEQAQEARSAVHAQATVVAERTRERDELTKALQAAKQERLAILTRSGLAPDAPVELVDRAIAASESRDERTRRTEALTADVDRFAHVARAFTRAQETRGTSTPDLDSFPQEFRTVAERCQRAALNREEAVRIDNEVEKADQELARRTATRRSLQEDLEGLYARFGRQDAAGLQAAFAAAEELHEIDRRIQAEEGRLVDLEASYPALLADVATIPAEDDARLLAGRDEELQRLRDHVEALRDAAKECYARISHVRQQDDLTRLIQERDALEKERQDAVADWLRVGITKKLLEKVRERYERDHGPRVLQEASRLLAHITEGRYEAVGREPDGSYVLTRPDGRRVPAVPPHVSRATFAQVYLAIRLAYAEVHDGHGVPYLLDDVLSDFDDGRLERAVEVLGLLARRRQVVLFTHHGHVAERLSATGLKVTPLEAAPAAPSIMK